MGFYDLEGTVPEGTYGDLASISNSIIHLLCDFGQRSLPKDIFQAMTELFNSINPTTQLPDWLLPTASLLCLALHTLGGNYTNAPQGWSFAIISRSLFHVAVNFWVQTECQVNYPAMHPTHPYFRFPLQKSLACLAKV